jgi:hypothetical protein
MAHDDPGDHDRHGHHGHHGHQGHHDRARDEPARLTVFVYFKVPATIPPPEVHAAIDRLAAMRARDGHRFAVMRRHRERSNAPATHAPATPAPADASGTAGVVTWMEVHEGVPRDSLDAWLEALAGAAREAGVDRLAAGGRHVEVFESISG